MDDRLKIGIPDDEAATAPVQKYRVNGASSGFLSRWVFPLVTAALAFAADKVWGAGRSDHRRDDPDQRQDHDRSEQVAARHKVDEGSAAQDTEQGEASNPEEEDGVSQDEGKVVRLSAHRAWQGITRYDDVTVPEIPKARVFGDVFEFDAGESHGAWQGSFEFAQGRAVGKGVGRGDNLEESQDETEVDPGTGKSGRQEKNHAPVIRGKVRLPRLGSDEAVLLATSMLLAGASDPDGNPLFIASISSDSGEVSLEGDGLWMYVPEEGFIGETTIRFTISDGVNFVARSAKLEVTDSGMNEFDGTPKGDEIIASSGNDLITAGDGDDIVYGGSGDDVIIGGRGNDTLFGGAGDDQIFGGAGNDLIHGNGGNDTLFGGKGDDKVFGDAGDDVLFGGEGDDEVDGGEGDDVVFGEAGDDEVYGGSGEDVLDGGEGDDVVDGGDGDDVIIQSDACGTDTIRGGAGTDTLDLSRIVDASVIDLDEGTLQIGDGPQSTIESIENVIGGAGEDTIHASCQVNVIAGGEGNDRFVFDDLEDLKNEGHGHDKIVDFQAGDRIDLSVLKSDISAFGLAKLFFAGALSGAFQEAGAIQYYFAKLDTEDEDEHTVVRGRLGADDQGNDHEFEFELDGHHDLEDRDFIFDWHE